MTSLLAGPDRAAGSLVELRHRRPLAAVAFGGGVVAAAAVLTVCLALGVVGWFLTDAGTHGEPRDGLRVGALAWLMAHGSGVRVAGAPVTAAPLLLTVAAAWTAWRIGLRVGDSVSGHGPDADAISDGERDWTVPVAVALFAGGYAAVTVVTASLAASASSGADTTRAVVWSLAMAVLVGGPAIAAASGRAAIWATFLPPSLRAAAHTCRAILTAHLLVAALVLVGALAADLGTAANVLSQLGLGGGEVALFLVVTAALLPNAVLFSGAYLHGPGFTVGVDTLVAPTAVSLGPLPMFPLLAALPDDGTTPGWTPWLMAVPPVVAVVAAARAQRRHPTVRWEEGALRGCTGGVLAGLLTGVLASFAGGAVGPGRMSSVEPFASEVMVHAITGFGIGGLFGGLAMTWWQRRAARRVVAG